MGITNESRLLDLEHEQGGAEGMSLASTIWIDATDPDALERSSDAPVGVKTAPNFRTLKAAVKWIEREYPEIAAEDYNVIRGIVGHRTPPNAKFNIVDFHQKLSPKETAKQLQERIDKAADHAEAIKRQEQETSEYLAERRNK